jgi:hypothetical protein
MPLLLLILPLGGAVALYFYLRGNGNAADSLSEVDVSVSKIPEQKVGGIGGGSSANRPRSVRNHNPTNLRYISRNPFNGQIGNDGGYGIYETDALGVRAAFLNLWNYFTSGTNTIRTIVSKWAPSNENPTQAYINFLAQWVKVSPDQPLQYSTHAVAIIQGLARFETGFEAWPLSFFKQGYQDAGK